MEAILNFLVIGTLFLIACTALCMWITLLIDTIKERRCKNDRNKQTEITER